MELGLVALPQTNHKRKGGRQLGPGSGHLWVLVEPVLKYSFQVPVVDEGLPDVPGLLALSSDV